MDYYLTKKVSMLTRELKVDKCFILIYKQDSYLNK